MQTSLLPDFLASQPAMPEKEKAQKMIVGSGRKQLELFENFARPGLFSKMFSAYLLLKGDWYSSKSKLTWKLRGTRFNRMYFQLVPSMLPIEGIGSGLLPTPQATEYKDLGTNMDSLRKLPAKERLSRLLAHGLMPTPTASDKPTNINPTQLEGTVSGFLSKNLLPTPVASDNRDRGGPKDKSVQRRMQIGKSIELSMMVNGRLSPHFVLEMMGFPTNWTELPFQNGVPNQLKPPVMQSYPK